MVDEHQKQILGELVFIRWLLLLIAISMGILVLIFVAAVVQ